MAKRRRQKSRSKMNPQHKHIRIYRYMFDCTAYRSLSVYARCVLHEVMYRFNGTNNGYICLSHRETAKRLGVNRRTVAKSFDELERKGFFKARVRGAFNVKHRHATEWILTSEEYNGSEATKDFVRWLPPGSESRVHVLRPTRVSGAPIVHIHKSRVAGQ